MRKRKCAVFDIDGTIFRSSLLIESVEALVDTGAFPKRARKIFEGPHRRWLDRKDGYDKYIAAVITASDAHTTGIRRGDYLRIIRRVVRRHKDRVYRYTRDLLGDLKRRNYYLLAITHSPKYIADEFAKTLKFDKVYGRLFEIDARGRFTGGVLHEDMIGDKAKILLRAIKKENLTLRGSVGVGDSESDIPFLELVSRPICFNPNRKLYRVAKQMGWEVIVERKDVVYHIY